MNKTAIWKIPKLPENKELSVARIVELYTPLSYIGTMKMTDEKTGKTKIYPDCYFSHFSGSYFTAVVVRPNRSVIISQRFTKWQSSQLTKV